MKTTEHKNTCDRCKTLLEFGEGFNPDMGDLTPTQTKVAEAMNQGEEITICETCYWEYANGGVL